MNDIQTMIMRVATIIVLLTIGFALVDINKTLSRIADRLPVAVEVRTSE